MQLQDYVTQVVPGSIQLLVNNQAVTPAVSKSGALTTVTYTPIASLPPNKNTVRLIFGDSSTPTVLQTNDFSFGVAGADLLKVTPAMLSGAATFMATVDAYKSFKDPVPYGCANNATDAGWIWVDNDYFVVDFGAPTIVRQFRVYCTYPGNQAPDSGDTGERGALWSIDYSDDTNSWSQSTEFSFESAPGKGIQDDGSSRTDCVGWYGTSFNSQAEAHRFWRISQTGVLLKHAPRGAQAEFYGQITTPIVKSTAPSDGGNARTSIIKVELQDSLTQVATNSIQLWLNGKSVTPVVAKLAGTNVTTVTYDPQGTLPIGLSEVTYVFANSASPAVSVTNSFSFTVVPDDYLVVTPDMINGSTTFFATPAGVNIGSPIPYGFANNTTDQGWIWNNGSFVYVDFGVPTALKKLRAYSCYTLDAFAANWVIEYSTDQASYTKCADFAFENAVGGGINEDGTARDDCAGWYQTTFNESGVEARYWRIRQTEILIGTHAPRVAQIEFYGKIAAVAPLKLTYQRQASSMVLSWAGTATLQSAEQIKGPWTDISSANPQTINTTSSGKFYQLRQ